MNRLWVRLALAFGLVTLVAVMIAAFLANRQVSTQFQQYVMRTQMVDTLVPALAQHYAATESWTGVETVLDAVRGPGMGNGMGRGQGMGGPPGFLLADASGQVIYDRSNSRTGHSR